MAVKPLVIKVTAGIVGVGGAGVIAHQTYKALKTKEDETVKESNRDRLISQKYKILGTEKEKDVTWKAILGSYKEVIKNKSDLAFDGFSDTESDTALATLKNKCEDALNSKYETLLNKAKKWCIVPTTVKDGLKGRKILKTDDSRDTTEDQQEWNQKIKDYTKEGKNNEITDLKFSTTPINDPQKEHRDLIRKKCRELNDKKSYEGDYEEALKNSKKWCSNQ